MCACVRLCVCDARVHWFAPSFIAWLVIGRTAAWLFLALNSVQSFSASLEISYILLYLPLRCPFLHRTAGDTERRYHLRYYKTCMCVHDTDSRGYCVKNGLHCAFAHGMQDQRPPVYDIKELETLQNSDITLDGTNAQNALDKERNLMNEDPKWQDTNYVLANYKTEPCKRPPRLCRQGYACPQYHNSKDKRRSPRKYKYR